MISIITPVYNTKQFLPRCLDSILAQTYRDWELLLVDDGSTDGSNMICDQYAAFDSRIRVFHKRNAGVASARQLGIEQARGEYSIHIDSDDWVESNMLEEMVMEQQETDADILIADFYRENNHCITLQKQRSKDNSPLSALEDIVYGRQSGFLWNKLIRHELYRKYSISFAPGINHGEDSLVLAQLLQKPVKIQYLQKSYYHYLNNGSATLCRGYNKQMYENFSAYAEKMLEIVPDYLKNRVESNLRYNYVKGMQCQFVTASELKKNGVKLQFLDVFRRDVGNEYRKIVLLYLLGLIK